MTTQSQIDLLYKKFLGTPAAYPNNAPSQEAAGSSRPNIISQLQLFSQPIPNPAPNDFTTLYGYASINSSGKTLISITQPSGSVPYGTIYTSVSYPYIQKITLLPLTSITPNLSYYFNNPAFGSTSNLLANAIPFNYDPNTNSYNYFLYNSSEPSNALMPYNTPTWFVDPDAGYLYFPNGNWTGATPLISFYRYNGKMGIPTNLGNFAGAYAQDPSAIAIGNYAGYTGQGANAIALGNYAGAYGQGTGSIAIGYLAGPTGMSANSIVLNASGTALYGTGPTGGFYVAPVGSYSGSTGPFKMLAYGADNQIVTMGSNGLNSSTPTETQDPWLLTNLIGPPPAPTDLKIDTFTNDVFVMFTYPPQYNFGLINTLVPNITGAVLSINGSSTNLITNTTNYFKTKTSSTTFKPIQCLHFYKGSNNYNNISYTSSSNSLLVYTTEQIAHFNINDPSSPLANFYYTNFNSSINPLNFTISYTKAGLPGSQNAPNNITITFNGFSGGGESSTITINLSSDEYYADVDNNYIVSSSTPLTDKITYRPVSNSVRFGGTDTIERTSSPFITTSPSPSFSLSTNVYPDTKYKIILSSSNGTNLTQSNEIAITAATPGVEIAAVESGRSYITSNLSDNQFKSLTLPTSVQAKPTAGGSAVTVLTNTTNIKGVVTFQVHNSFANRGVSQNAKITNISSSLLTASSITETSTPSFTLNNTWFNASNSWTNENTNISLNPKVFVSLGSGALSGYYATCDIETTLNTSNYLTSASASAYMITTTGTYPEEYVYSFKSDAFYYDGLLPTPTCTINSLTINTSPTQISGITLYNDAINVTPGITVSNIGTHFYNSTKTVDYSGSIGGTVATVKNSNNNTTETGLPNGYTSSSKSGTFNNSLTFTKISSKYSTSLSLTATAYNISGTGQASNIYSKNIIYDTNSVVPITSPNSIGIGANAVGCRLWSVYSSTEANRSSIGKENASPNNNGKFLTYYDESLSSYNSFSNKKFDDTFSLVDTNYQYELLYANGNYTTTTAYALDYTNYGGLYDYRTIQSTTFNGYKYATFMWTFSPQSSTINSVNFTFNNTNYTPTLSGTADSVTVTVNGYPHQMQLYYRLENPSLPLGNTIDVSTALNTPWINGTNASGGTNFTSNNISGSSATTLVYRGLNSLTSSTFNCALVPLTSTNFSSGTLNLYCRIAIPVSSGFMFSSISASLSS